MRAMEGLGVKSSQRGLETCPERGHRETSLTRVWSGMVANGKLPPRWVTQTVPPRPQCSKVTALGAAPVPLPEEED